MQSCFFAEIFFYFFQRILFQFLTLANIQDKQRQTASFLWRDYVTRVPSTEYFSGDLLCYRVLAHVTY